MMKVFLVLLLCMQAFASHITSKWKIVGGNTATDTQFPYQIQIVLGMTYVSGGALLAPTKILSCAHCVERRNVESLTAIGGTNINFGEGQRHRLSSYILHPDYSSATATNDIAVLHLKSSFIYNTKVQSIPINTNTVGSEVEAVISGYGLTASDGNQPWNLKYINVATISNTDCAETLAGTTYPVTDNNLCTFIESGKGTCNLDSGSPVASGGELIGIVSWSIPCAIGYPDVHTRLSQYVEWINQN